MAQDGNRRPKIETKWLSNVLGLGLSRRETITAMSVEVRRAVGHIPPYALPFAQRHKICRNFISYNQHLNCKGRDRAYLLQLKLPPVSPSIHFPWIREVKYLYFLLALISVGLLYETGRTTTVRAIARFLFIFLVIAFIAVLILAGSGVA